MPGNQDPLHRTHLHFGGKEPEKAAGLAHDLLAGLVDADAEMDLAVVVAVDPLDRDRAALEHARLQVGLEARPDHHLPAAAEDHAVDLDLGQPARGVAHVGRGLRRLARDGIAHLHAPVQLQQLLRRHGAARARSSP